MKLHLPLLVLLGLTLTACSDGGSFDGGDAPATAAVIATRAPDFSSGAISLVDVNAPFTARNNLPPNDTSDLFVRSGGDHYFAIQRFGANRVLRLNAASPTNAVYSYSTNDVGDAQDSNPSELIIVSPTKAYLLRYGSGKLWIVNPAATSAAGFKTGEISLAQYDPDGVPEMTAGLLKNGRLYVLMQRLQSFNAVRNGYVAVIDTATDAEVPTTPNADGLRGIELPLRNPGAIVANPDNDDLVVIAGGGFDNSFNPVYDGGIARINSSTRAVQLLVDDGAPGSTPFGQLQEMVIVDGERGYFIGSLGFFANQNLFRFNPTSTATPVAVAAAQNLKLSTLAADDQDRVWLGLSADTAPGVRILDARVTPETVISARIDTALTPINIDFISAP